MRPARRWGLVGAVVLLGGLAAFVATAPQQQRHVPWHFWVRMDEDPRRVHAAIGAAPDPRWTVRWGPLSSNLVEVVVIQDDPSPVIGLLRDVGVLSHADGGLCGVALWTPEVDPKWRECVTTNAPWPEDATVDPAFAGDWEETGGSVLTGAHEPRTRRYVADGSTSRVEWPKSKCRWARVDDVVVIGVWNAAEGRWHTGDAVLLDPDGESYRTFAGATGRRVR